MAERYVEYTHEGALLEGFMAWDDSLSGARPGVLVSHAWGGRGELECDKARELAGLGYCGFALDVYGKGVRGTNAEENTRLMQPAPLLRETRMAWPRPSKRYLRLPSRFPCRPSHPQPTCSS